MDSKKQNKTSSGLKIKRSKYYKPARIIVPVISLLLIVAALFINDFLSNKRALEATRESLIATAREQIKMFDTALAGQTDTLE